MLTLQQIQERAYATAKAKGWHKHPLITTTQVGVVFGTPKFNQPVQVIVEGPHAGKLCASSDARTMLLRGKLFGLSTGKDQAAIRTVQHDSVLRMQALMHTELTEAYDALEEGYDEMYLGEGGKPEGFPVEIADLVIRVCDTMGALGLQLDRPPDCANAPSRPDWYTRAKDMRPSWEIQRQSDEHATTQCALLWLGKARTYIDRATEEVRVDDWEGYADNLTLAVLYAASIVAGYGHNLPAAIEAKMAYNETRSHRHGGKQA